MLNHGLSCTDAAELFINPPQIGERIRDLSGSPRVSVEQLGGNRSLHGSEVQSLGESISREAAKEYSPGPALSLPKGRKPWDRSEICKPGKGERKCVVPTAQTAKPQPIPLPATVC